MKNNTILKIIYILLVILLFCALNSCGLFLLLGDNPLLGDWYNEGGEGGVTNAVDGESNPWDGFAESIIFNNDMRFAMTCRLYSYFDDDIFESGELWQEANNAMEQFHLDNDINCPVLNGTYELDTANQIVTLNFTAPEYSAAFRYETAVDLLTLSIDSGGRTYEYYYKRVY